MTDYERECVEEALAIAEDLLTDNQTYSADKTAHMVIVDSAKLLRIVQELNASLKEEG